MRERQAAVLYWLRGFNLLAPRSGFILKKEYIINRRIYHHEPDQ
jgi:hypothetical protein